MGRFGSRKPGPETLAGLNGLPLNRMKNLILLFLFSISLLAQNQPQVRGRYVVLQEGGTLNDPEINGTITGDALAAIPIAASQVTSGALDEARIAVGTWNTNTVVVLDAAGYPIATNRLSAMRLTGPTRRQGTMIDELVDHGTATEVIWDVQSGIFQKLTLSGATTIVLTNLPTASEETLFSQLTITGNGAHDVQFLNIDLFTLGSSIETNNLATGETRFSYDWSGAVGTFTQSPEPYLTGLTGNIQTALDAKATYAGITNTLTFALSDMTTALTTGTNKNYWYAPAAGMTIKGVRLTLATASSSGTPTVDINEAGTTILSTKITVDQDEWDSVNATAAAVISDSAIAANAKLDFDIDVAGTGAAGAQVQILYTVP
jgi:hypothetical protein